MTRSTQFALAALVSVGLAAPALAAESAARGDVSSGHDAPGLETALPAAEAPASVDEQARPRPGGSSSSGSSSGSASSGSSGSSSSSGVSSGSSSGQARPRPAGSTSSGTAVSRGSATTSGGSGGGGARPGTSSATRGGAPGGPAAVVRSARDRAGRTITGNAVARDVASINPPFFGPWGRWFPYYGSGWGPSFGFVVFNPYGIWGGSYWNWYRGGYWYDPYPYGWYSAWVYGGGGSYSSSSSGRRGDGGRFGSIRLKASPETANVYVDGALVGVVDDFNGLSGHLQLDEGVYQLELRAAGYEPYSGQLEVKSGKTLTERVKLKKVK